MKITKDEIARALFIPTEELENLLFGLAGPSPEGSFDAMRPPLRLIS
jgi:hypothetical protein